MNEEEKIVVTPEMVKDCIDKDPFSAVLFLMLFFVMPGWEVPKDKEIEEMRKMLNEQFAYGQPSSEQD